jgi:hypothetical protein
VSSFCDMKTWTTGWTPTEVSLAQLAQHITPHELKLIGARCGAQNSINQHWRLVYWFSVILLSGVADSTLSFGNRAR